MIISHQHRFIYIKTLKTAGTSLEIALAKFCGPNDIITPIDRFDESTRRALGFPTAQNFRPSIVDIMKDFSKNCTRQHYDIVKYFNHMSASMVRDRVGPEIWNNYFKFTSARHPIDRALSLFYWRNKTKTESPNMKHFLCTQGGELYRNTEIVSESGEFLLDSFVRFEFLNEDLEVLSEKIGLPESLWCVFRDINTKTRQANGLNKNDVLVQSEDVRHIEYICSKEYDYFGYV